MARQHVPTITVAERLRVGERLRLLRLERRLDQRTLARQAHVSLVTLQMIEKGAGRAVRIDNVVKVAEALGTSLSVLREPTVHDLSQFNHEDVEMARMFHTAILDVKVAVRTLLETEAAESQRRTAAQLVPLLLSLSDAHRALLRVVMAIQEEAVIRKLLQFAEVDAPRAIASVKKTQMKHG